MSSIRYDIDGDIYITEHLSDADLPSMLKYLNNPVIYANTTRIPSPYTAKDAESFIQLINAASDGSHFFTVRLHENDEMIGACGIHPSGANKRVAEIGYWLGEPYWRRGFMSKVINKAIEIVKDFVRIEAQVYTWNAASKRVLEKCGFAYEGLLRKRLHKNGKDIDVYLYALIIE